MNTYDEYIKINGVYLKPIIGVESWALNKKNTLNAIQILRSATIPVLGVDALIKNEDKFYFIYQDQVQGSFACQRNENESEQDFAERSATEVASYIESYPNGNENNRFFTIVPKIKRAGTIDTKE